MNSYRLLGPVLLLVVGRLAAGQNINLYRALLGKHYSEPAVDEFERLLIRAKHGDSAVFPTCAPTSRRPKTKCYSATALSLIEKIRPHMVAARCTPPSKGHMDLIETSATRFVDQRKLEILTAKTEECGGTCRRRLWCCGETESFYDQGIGSEPCSSSACRISALTRQEKRVLGVRDVCDMAKAPLPDWKLFQFGSKLISRDVGAINRRLICALYGTAAPRLNCVRYGDSECQCCCHNYRPVNGRCVKLEHDKSCQ